MGKEERQVVIDRAAEEELEAAAAWYDDEDPGLGRDLLTAVEETFYLVRRFPSMASPRPAIVTSEGSWSRVSPTRSSIAIWTQRST